MKNTRLGLILIGATVLLLVPFIAMQFSNEVVWTSSDFVLMGILLFGTGLSIETILRKVKTVKNRILLSAAILAVFFLLWAEMAVGLFGSPIAGS